MSVVRLSDRVRGLQSPPIGRLMATALQDPQIISLAAGFVDQQSLPHAETWQALQLLDRDAREARRALQYGTTAGYAPLREAILADHLAADGVLADEAHLSADDVVLTAGSNQLLHLVAESILDPGDIVLCAAPTYFVFLSMLQFLRARPLGVATDPWGMVPRALHERLQALERDDSLARAKAVYLVSYFDNPRGTTIPLQRRQEILEVLDKWSAKQWIWLIEDVAYRELRYDGPDVPSFRALDPSGRRVVVAGTFSKSFSPGLRVGWGILPRTLCEPVCHQKGNIDFGSPNFNQQLMYQVVRTGLFRQHVQKIRTVYREKLDAMCDAAHRWLAPLAGVRWQKPQGGLYLWLELPPSLDTGPSSTLFRRAVDAGVLYVPGQFGFPPEGVAQQNNTIRLSFGVQTPERIQQGVRLLADVIGQQPECA